MDHRCVSMAGGNRIVGNVLDHRFVSTTEGDRIVKIATDHRSVNTIERDTVVKTVVGQVSGDCCFTVHRAVLHAR